MDVEYSRDAGQAELVLLKQASALLADILGPQSSKLVKAAWKRVDDQRGRALYRLTISDFTGEASTDFTLDELQNPLHMRVRMYRLWGDLLQARNNEEQRRVNAISGLIAAGAEGH